ncbi:MAG: FAD-dependent oxidoreductase [Pseudomonadota bacterium]
MSDHIVIAGGGHAAGQLAVSLRTGGFDGRLTIIGDESHAPYQRPPLSKKFLSGEVDINRLYIKPPEYYADNDIDLKLDTRINTINTAAQTVSTDEGDIDWDHLVLATGSRVRTLDVSGSALNGIHYLRTAADVDHIRQHFAPGARLVIVGGGYIGLEVAAVAVKAGLDVHVVEAEDRLLSRVVSPTVSEFYLGVHQQEGVTVHLNAIAQQFSGETNVSGVTLSDGSTLAADLVIVGIGIVPNTELAEAAGIHCDNGIVVNEFCETGTERVLAIGDCTNHPNPLLERNLRLESVPNALEQARTAAATLLGERNAYAEVPWFWSDQYDLKLQIVGLTDGYDQTVIRGDIALRQFACFYLKQGRMIAVDAISSPREFLFSKPLVARKARIPAEVLADASVSLKDAGAEFPD